MLFDEIRKADEKPAASRRSEPGPGIAVECLRCGVNRCVYVIARAIGNSRPRLARERVERIEMILRNDASPADEVSKYRQVGRRIM